MLLLLTLNIFIAFFMVSIVEFEQVNVCWVYNWTEQMFFFIFRESILDFMYWRLIHNWKVNKSQHKFHKNFFENLLFSHFSWSWYWVIFS